MNYGTTSCPDGYDDVYLGYAMASYANTTHELRSSNLICDKDEKFRNRHTRPERNSSAGISFIAFANDLAQKQFLECVLCRKIESAGPANSGQQRLPFSDDIMTSTCVGLVTVYLISLCP